MTSEMMANENDESLQAPTILLRVRRQRRGAITASSTICLELDAALAAADDAFNEWDIHSPDETDDDQIRINESSNGEREFVSSSNNNKNHHHHRVSVSSRSRQSATSVSTLTTTASSSTAIFRRIESSSFASHDDVAMCKNAFNFHQNKRPRILDAVLLTADDDDDDSKRIDGNTEEAVCGNQKGDTGRKRRRLTLQILEPQKLAEGQQRRRSSLLLQYPILSPQQRLIDDSLQQVFAGTVTLQQHCQLIHESAMVLTSEQSDSFWPYVWCHADYGNWLHAAAIWNEASAVREMFHIVEEKFDQLQISKPASSQYHQYATLIREIIQTQNYEGLNPLQVAQLSSNSEVYAVLEHYYNSYNQEDDDLMNGDDMDDDGHQYELYSLVLNRDLKNMYDGNVAGSQQNDIGQQLADENDDDPILVTNCELHNGCRGYWDERGNLILETPGSAVLDLDLDRTEKNRNAIHQENLDIDDIDSNDEDWGGNDYPDEDDENEFASENDDDEQASENETYGDFRRRHVNVYGHNHGNVGEFHAIDDYDEDDDAHYDPSYGDIYGQNDSLDR